jgi:putative membrane protein
LRRRKWEAFPQNIGVNQNCGTQTKVCISHYETGTTIILLKMGTGTNLLADKNRFSFRRSKFIEAHREGNTNPTMKETDPLLNNGDHPERLPSLVTMLRKGVVLTNAGSTARDHLANERTYLAWIRTALALTGVGIGLLRWGGIANSEGYLVLALGVLVLISSTQRYLLVMQQLSIGRFEPNVRSALGIVVVILTGVIALLALQATHQL